MSVYQVALGPNGRTSLRLRGDGEVLVYVLQGVVHMELPAVDAPLRRGDSVKMRHCIEATWRSDDDTPSLVLVGIGPSATIVDVMVNAQVSVAPAPQ